MTDNMDARRKRILYRASYRGFKEADLLIGGFARASVPGMSDAELDQFEALLKENDRDIYAWALGESDPPADLRGSVLDRLRAFKICD